MRVHWNIVLFIILYIREIDSQGISILISIDKILSVLYEDQRKVYNI